ncbi:MAG: S8 family serine peptidase [Verrucomicrobiales bacterium]
MKTKNKLCSCIVLLACCAVGIPRIAPSGSSNSLTNETPYSPAESSAGQSIAERESPNIATHDPSEDSHAAKHLPMPRVPLPKIALRSPRGEHHQVIVKFRDDVAARAQDTGELYFDQGDVSNDVRTAIAERNLKFKSMFDVETLEAARELAQRAEENSGRAQPDVDGLFIVDAGTDEPLAVLELAMALNDWDAAEFVHIRSLDAVIPPPITDDRTGEQIWQDNNPGVSAKFAWSQFGRGSGVRLSVIEQGYNPNHEDLVDTNITDHRGTGHVQVSADVINHGTMTMGVIAAGDNGFGVTGLASDAEVHFYPEQRASGVVDRPGAITLAANDSEPGDIILLEMQTDTVEGNGMLAPAETEPLVWIATRMAVDAGIIVVAAAGNGAADLDSAAYADYRASGDSGAIIVGAGVGADRLHRKIGFSTFGSRVDLHSWGSGVLTTKALAGAGDEISDDAYGDFNGTSSASAIVAAACASLQSAHLATNGTAMTPNLMRTWLRATGYTQSDPENGKIGPALSLQSTLARYIGSVPLATTQGQSTTIDFNDDTLPTHFTGWRYMAERGAETRVSNGRLLLERPATFLNSSTGKLAAATLKVNLKNKGGVTLSFRHTNRQDIYNAPQESFHVGTANVDGVFMSADGEIWHQLPVTLGDGDTDKLYSINLDSAIRAANIDYTLTFQIRFQCYSKSLHPLLSAGRAFDDITLALSDTGSLEFEKSSAYAVVREGEPQVNLWVERKNGTAGQASTQFFVTPVTATAGEDYSDSNGIVTFNAGQTRALIQIPIPDDQLIEGIESFQVRLGNPHGSTWLGDELYAKVRILDNDTDDDGGSGFIYQQEWQRSWPASNGTVDPSGGTDSPMTMDVTGATGTITGVHVRLFDISHENGADLDMLLVAPDGKSCILMSDASEGHGFWLSQITFGTGDDVDQLPLFDQLQSSQTYGPGNYAPINDTYPAGAPTSYNESLEIFNGIDPNGQWKLYVVDDTPSQNDGWIRGGWELRFTTTTTVQRIEYGLDIVGATPNEIILRVFGKHGGHYMVESSPTMDPGSWISEMAFIPNDSAAQTIQVPRNQQTRQQFYRLVDTTDVP